MDALPAIPVIDVRSGGPLAHATERRAAMEELRDCCTAFLPRGTRPSLRVADAMGVHAVIAPKDRAAGIIRLVGLAGREHVAARFLSYGQRRLLEIGVALAGEPQLLLMDEPTSGLGSRPMETLRELVQRLAAGLTIVVIEHDMDFVLTLCHDVTVLHRGTVIAQGTPDAIRDNREVREAYLGTLKYTKARG